ncbi:protein of unknown function [Xenorhabdus bovienii]|uniref:Uncharacterized protein n=1 Tax=Xenorhabdus bovienii TaxID=40576 RepID=A0A0B6X9X2_XENBV|nr:protein of unknown function [Xenorhabdus bovienii]
MPINFNMNFMLNLHIHIDLDRFIWRRYLQPDQGLRMKF